MNSKKVTKNNFASLYSVGIVKELSFPSKIILGSFATRSFIANLGKYEILYENYSEGNDDINGTTITLVKPFDNKKYKFYQIITGQGKDIAKSLFFLAEDNIKTFTFQTIKWTSQGSQDYVAVKLYQIIKLL